MKYVPIPLALLEVGKPLPVDVLSDSGQLLLRRGQPVLSEQHRDKLRAFHACTHAADGMAWQRAYERMVHEMLRNGVEVGEIARASMPAEMQERYDMSQGALVAQADGGRVVAQPRNNFFFMTRVEVAERMVSLPVTGPAGSKRV